MSLSRFSLALDLDGTLIDTWDRQLDLLDACARNAGLGPLDLPAVQAARREGASNRVILESLGATAYQVDAACSQWIKDVESDQWLDRDQLLSGVPAVLDRLYDEGATLSLITARQRPEAVARQLANLGLSQYVSKVCVVSPLRASQEKSHALHVVGARAYVGDTVSDALACRSAHIPFFSVVTGQHSKRMLREAGVSNLSDCLAAAVAKVKAFAALEQQ